MGIGTGTGAGTGTGGSPRVDAHGPLPPGWVAEVLALVEAATAVDGVAPLSEHVLLHLRYGGESAARNLLVRAPGGAPDGAAEGALAGYAHVDVTDQVTGASAELVVAPSLRGRGYGRALAEEASRQAALAGSGRLRLWAHGNVPGALALARSAGFEQMRALWQMRRPLDQPLPEVRLPPGIAIRPFRPGADEEAWLAANARAFADHPEQGTWTMQDLRRRLQEPWFDPDGFFLAERAAERDAGQAAERRPRRAGGGRRLVGFHWTKVHGDEHAGAHAHRPLGEVYVLGVDPAEHGGGLGRALSLVGLHHLRRQGLPEAMLYVEADNAPALRLYTSLGFRHVSTDAMFSRELA